MTNEVVLVPGLWVPAAVMTLLAARLARSGYVTRGFGYRGRAPLAANMERLARFIDGRTVHQIGMPWHFGYGGIAKGAIANDLSALIEDPNSRIHEGKSFTCSLRRKM